MQQQTGAAARYDGCRRCWFACLPCRRRARVPPSAPSWSLVSHNSCLVSHTARGRPRRLTSMAETSEQAAAAPAAEITLRAAGALSAQLSVSGSATVAELRALIAARLGLGAADAAALKLICGGTRLQVCSRQKAEAKQPAQLSRSAGRSCPFTPHRTKQRGCRSSESRREPRCSSPEAQR